MKKIKNDKGYPTARRFLQRKTTDSERVKWVPHIWVIDLIKAVGGAGQGVLEEVLCAFVFYYLSKLL